jgi:hypothetical protein
LSGTAAASAHLREKHGISEAEDGRRKRLVKVQESIALAMKSEEIAAARKAAGLPIVTLGLTKFTPDPGTDRQLLVSYFYFYL